MFRDLLDAKRTLIHDAVDELVRMIERAQRMFDASCGLLLDGTPVEGALAEDEDINVGERLVRRLVAQHLVISPERDLPASLALLSTVHDVERLGDYAKSLVELTPWADALAASPLTESCRGLHQTIAPQFDLTLRAVRDSDVDAAREVMRIHMQVKETTDGLLQDAMSRAGAAGSEAVLYGVASRYLRRVSGHLSNVASSVVNPLDQLAGQETPE
ncbi:MAG: PhoU domain-containing protein [Candidatus Latescibacterota bacterium]|nr:PhoU domain-containing protein [Candidatus Latescibacterota bacterium]